MVTCHEAVGFKSVLVDWVCSLLASLRSMEVLSGARLSGEAARKIKTDSKKPRAVRAVFQVAPAPISSNSLLSFSIAIDLGPSQRIKAREATGSTKGIYIKVMLYEQDKSSAIAVEP